MRNETTELFQAISSFSARMYNKSMDMRVDDSMIFRQYFTKTVNDLVDKYYDSGDTDFLIDVALAAVQLNVLHDKYLIKME